VLEKYKGTVLPALLSLLFAAVGQCFIYYLKNIPAGLIFFLFAIIALVIVSRYNESSSADKNDFFPSSIVISKKMELIVFFIILTAAAFMRLYKIGSIPAGGYCDEAANGLIALDILHGKALPIFNAGQYNTSNAAALIYLITAVFKLIGSGMTQIRFTSVIFGILAVPAFYFLIRSLAGAVPALLGAFILAVMRWHINFSRIGFQASLGVFAVILVIYFTFKAYYNKKTSDFIILGLLVDFSIYAYRTAMVLPVALIVFLLFMFFYDPAYFKGNIRNFVLCVVTGLIGLVPLMYYAVNNRALFMDRQNQVSIFNSSASFSPETRTWISEKRPKFDVFADNVKKTFLMFNYKGDSNARHNLPYEPELDFIIGMFAITGFGFALTKLFNPVYFFFTTAFIILMSSGYLTIEAPQSLRTLNAMPCVIFFSLIFIGQFTATLKSRKEAVAGWGIIALLLVGSAAYNFNIYFNKQATDSRCWEDFSTKEYYAGEAARTAVLSGKSVVALNDYLQHPTFIFESGEDSRCEKFDMVNIFGGQLSGDKDIMYVLPVAYMPIANYLKEIYPHTNIAVFSNKFRANPLFICFTITSTDIKSPVIKIGKSGITAQFFEKNEFKGKSVAIKEPLIMMTHYDDPKFIIASAIWSGTLNIKEPGSYKFDISSFGASSIYIDKKLVFNVMPHDDRIGASTNSASIFLEKGSHFIRVEYNANNPSESSDGRGNAGLWLFWQKPGQKALTLVPGYLFSSE
jgi:4-amino-4-deoxy-L-arabinose transferase-like glycosyltransferase